jgi:hypothetical protein
MFWHKYKSPSRSGDVPLLRTLSSIAHVYKIIVSQSGGKATKKCCLKEGSCMLNQASDPARHPKVVVHPDPLPPGSSPPPPPPAPKRCRRRRPSPRRGRSGTARRYRRLVALRRRGSPRCTTPRCRTMTRTTGCHRPAGTACAAMARQRTRPCSRSSRRSGWCTTSWASCRCPWPLRPAPHGWSSRGRRASPRSRTQRTARRRCRQLRSGCSCSCNLVIIST